MLIAGDVIQLPLYAASCSYLSYGCIHVYQHLFRLDQHRNRFPLQVLTAFLTPCMDNPTIFQKTFQIFLIWSFPHHFQRK